MMRTRVLLPIVLVIGVTIALSSCDILGETESAPIVIIEPGKDDVSSDIHYNGDMTIIDIHSKSGIGSMDVSYDSGSQSPDLVLRLHLRGLENLQLQVDDTIVEASVSSSHPYDIRQSVVPENDGSVEINPTDPRWLNITIETNDTSEQAKIPLEDGYFQAAIPHEIFSGDLGPEESHLLSVSWIDFYR